MVQLQCHAKSYELDTNISVVCRLGGVHQSASRQYLTVENIASHRNTTAFEFGKRLLQSWFLIVVERLQFAQLEVVTASAVVGLCT